MQLSVTFRHMEPSDALKDYAREKLSRIEKYLDSVLEANVVLSVEKFRHTADVTIVSDGFKVNGQEQTDDMYSAIDMVADKMERQVKRNRQKITGRKKSAKRAKAREDRIETIVQDSGRADDSPRIIRVQQTQAKPMDVDEAVMQLELSSESFIVFTNSENEKINVLYRRQDGDYGLIEPMTD